MKPFKLRLAIQMIVVLFALPMGAQAREIKSSDLPVIQEALNQACGDNWCDGGAFDYDFLSVKQDGPGLKIKVRSTRAYGEKGKGPRVAVKLCSIFGYSEIEQILEPTEHLTDPFIDSVYSCIFTVFPNP